MERLLALDFDGTVALTSEADTELSIRDVNGAYSVAIGEVLGSQAAIAFDLAGGHNHRTPAEIAADLMPAERGLNVEEAAQLITDIKMNVLLDQVGRPLADGALWPRLTDGFDDMWTTICSQRHIATAVISAGHVDFIAKTFEVHNLVAPDDIVTDEVVVDAGFGFLPPQKRAKPDSLIMALTFGRWRQGLTLPTYMVTRDDVLYVGDDPVKDGGLARNSDVMFEPLVPGRSRDTWRKVLEWAQQEELVVPVVVREES
jgi:hypothetical protein